MCTNILQVLQTNHVEGNAFLLHVSYMPPIKGVSASVTSSNSECFSNITVKRWLREQPVLGTIPSKGTFLTRFGPDSSRP